MKLFQKKREYFDKYPGTWVLLRFVKNKKIIKYTLQNQINFKWFKLNFMYDKHTFNIYSLHANFIAKICLKIKSIISIR